MKIGVIGASGLVGRNILKQLDLLNFDKEIFAYSSDRSAGKSINGHFMISLKKENIQPLDFVFFATSSNLSKEWAPLFAEKGATIIDNSCAFRREPSVPLIVPEINFNQRNSSKIIANPNCSTIQIALPLYCLNKINPIKRVVVSTYQSASGAGQKGLDDLINETTNKFPYVLSGDLIPQIDSFLSSGFTIEEDKIRFELRKILSLPKLKINSTAVRVPIPFCHGASIYVECENPVKICDFKRVLSKEKSICLMDNIEKQIYPLTKYAKNTDKVYVGRIRKDLDFSNALSFWVVADNLRKGASSNAIQILIKFLKSEGVND